MNVPTPDSGHVAHVDVNDSNRGKIKPVIANSANGSEEVSADEK